MLSSEAKKVLYALYCEYKARRAVGISKMDARFFRSAKSIQEDFLQDMPTSDVEDALRELDDSDFMENFYADGTIYTCNLTNEAISTIENLPKDILLNVLDFVSKFIP